MRCDEITIKDLLVAYTNGYFPMPAENNIDVLWYKPDPRAIIPLDKFHVSRSLRRSLKNRGYEFRRNTAFSEVMQACSERKDTWINAEFKKIYFELHRRGLASSFEIWCEGELVGGLYGVEIAKAFFAESKFHLKTDASKCALYYLVEYMKVKGMQLLEVQFMTDHLRSLGAIHIPESEYMKMLKSALASL